MRRIIFQKHIHRSDLQRNPDILYVFGDNEERFGMGGQASQMRGEPNAVGVATKRSTEEFWCEEDLDRQCAVIDKDMAPLFKHNGIIVWPTDGIGTGLAMLYKKSPSTLDYITKKLHNLSNP